MAKVGILHDYDLMANAEDSVQHRVCAMCGTSPMTFQWSDYSGEGMCTQCGCPYQLKWGSEQQQTEGKYPYLCLTEQFLPIAREYWNLKKQWVCYGTMLGPRSGIDELDVWVRANHPEILESGAAA